MRCAQPCSKVFALIVSVQTITVGCFFLCVLGLILAFLWGKSTAGFESCNRNEKQRELFFPSLPHLSKAPLTFPPKVKSFQALHFWVSSCWEAKDVLWTFLLGHTKQRFQPLQSIWKVSCFQPSPPWSNWEGGMNVEIMVLGKGSFTQTLVALCAALLWQPGQPVADHYQLTWGCGLRRTPPHLLCACPHHFMPDRTMAADFKLPFFIIGP